MSAFTADIFYLLQVTAIVWLPLWVLSWLSMYYCRLLGQRTTLILGVVGVPIHELSHLLLCLLFGHKIQDFSLYKPSADGSLGYVEHQYKISWFSPFANLMIGLAPIAGGLGAFVGLTFWLRPDLISHLESLNESVSALSGIRFELAGVLAQITSTGGIINTVCWVLIGFSILLFCAPSRADFAGCKSGVVMIFVSLLFVMYFYPQSARVWIALADPWLTFVGSLLISIIAITGTLFAAVFTTKRMSK